MSYEEKPRPPAKFHSLKLEGREKLELSGVDDVTGFDESLVILTTNLGDLSIRGQQLHIEQNDKLEQAGVPVGIVTGICAFVVLTEIVSILENLCAINPQIAKVLDRFPGHPADPDPTIRIETETTTETPASDAKEPESATKHADLSDMTLQ